MSAYWPRTSGSIGSAVQTAQGLALCCRDFADETPWWQWRKRRRWLRIAASIERLVVAAGWANRVNDYHHFSEHPLTEHERGVWN